MERGNTKHGPAQDEQLKHEAQPIVQGHGGPSHVEEWRQSEPMPDDTDSSEVTTAAGMYGEERDEGAPVYAAAPDTSGDLSGDDEVIFTTETGGSTETAGTTETDDSTETEADR
jgi:hypothetical protein